MQKKNSINNTFTKSINKGIIPISTKQRRREITNQSASIRAALCFPKYERSRKKKNNMIFIIAFFSSF